MRQFGPVRAVETMRLLRSITLAIKDELVYTRRGEGDPESPGNAATSSGGAAEDFAVLMMEGDACA